MPTATYEPIATATVTGSSVTNITLSSIPSTYTDLILVGNIIYSANNGDYISLRFNNDTASNYAINRMTGAGTATGESSSSDNKIVVYSASTGQYVPYIVDINNYANTTTQKNALIRISNGTAGVVGFGVGTWRGTSAINRIDIFFAIASIAASSTVTLYGVKAE